MVGIDTKRNHDKKTLNAKERRFAIGVTRRNKNRLVQRRGGQDIDIVHLDYLYRQQSPLVYACEIYCFVDGFVSSRHRRTLARLHLVLPDGVAASKARFTPFHRSTAWIMSKEPTPCCLGCGGLEWIRSDWNRVVIKL